MKILKKLEVISCLCYLVSLLYSNFLLQMYTITLGLIAVLVNNKNQVWSITCFKMHLQQGKHSGNDNGRIIPG